MKHEEEVGPARTGRLLAPGRPAIWVAPEGGHPVQGGWVDAARPALLVNADITEVLARTTPPAAPGAWEVHAFRYFHGLDLGPRPPLPRLSRIARGIAKYGEAFARWAEVAPELRAPLSEFPSRYLGHFTCRCAYVEFVVLETRSSRGSAPTEAELQRVGAWSVRFAARKWAETVVFADAEEGGVHAFSRW